MKNLCSQEFFLHDIALEGIGLSIDEEYAIVQECYPYLARRLFTDRSPRAKKALRAMLGLSEEEEEKKALASTSSGLAFVQAGAQGEAAPKSSGGALSPSKLLEMSDGFASYTAATSDVDRDGAGQTAAVTEFIKLLLDPKGSTLQDILVEEASRLGDAATRSVLKASFVDSAPAKTVGSLLKTQKDLWDQTPLGNLVPKPLRTTFIDRPAELPQLMESLLTLSPEDEKLLQTAADLRDALSSRLSKSNDQQDMVLAERISSPNASFDTETLRNLLQNEETRQFVFEQVPGAAALARRLSAGLLRRAAFRAEKSGELSDETRQSLMDLNSRLAGFVDVPGDESESNQ